MPVGVGLAGVTSSGVAAGAAGHGGAAVGTAGGVAAGTSTAAIAGGAAGGAAAGAPTAATTGSAMAVVAGKWMAGGFLVATSAAGAVYRTEVLQDPAPAAKVQVSAATSKRPTRNTPEATNLRLQSLGPDPVEQVPAERRPTVGRLPDWGPRDLEARPSLGQHPLGEELALVRQVDAELRTGRPGPALDLLRRGGDRFGRGELAEEREALEIIALCALERGTGGARAAAFLAGHPRSVYARRLRDACRLDAVERPAPAAAPQRTPSPTSSPKPGLALPRQRFDDIESP